MTVRRFFNIRTALIAMFSVLTVCFIVLAVVYVSSVQKAIKTSNVSTVDVIERSKFDGGNTIRVPEVVVVGEPFVYETGGKKLVENGADVRLQVNCTIDGYDTPYTLSTFYSDLPKGEFHLKRSATVAVTSRLKSSDTCKLTSVATYIFYRVDDNGNETSFTVKEVGESNTFRLEVPVSPATQPTQN